MSLQLIEVSDETTDYEDIFLSVADIVPSVEKLVEIDPPDYSITKLTSSDTDLFKQLVN